MTGAATVGGAWSDSRLGSARDRRLSQETINRNMSERQECRLARGGVVAIAPASILGTDAIPKFARLQIDCLRWLMWLCAQLRVSP